MIIEESENVIFFCAKVHGTNTYTVYMCECFAEIETSVRAPLGTCRWHTTKFGDQVLAYDA